MTEVGIEVSKQGIDVKKAGYKDLIFTSRLNQMKIVKVLSGSYTKAGAGDEEFTLAHNLGFTPGFLPFLKNQSRWYGVHGEEPTSGLMWQISADTTNIVIRASGAGAGEAFSVKVFVLADEGTSSLGNTLTREKVGMVVSQENKDVKDAKDQDQAFSSFFPENLQIAKVLSIRNDRNPSVEEVAAHGLPYTPAWFALGVDNTGSWPVFLMPFLLVGARELMVWSDGTNIGTRIESISPSEDTTFKVVVLTNKLE